MQAEVGIGGLRISILSWVAVGLGCWEAPANVDPSLGLPSTSWA